MTRWHDASCEAPKVVLASNKLPTCNKCGRSCPAAEELIAARADTSAGPSMPPDKPPGQMNLWWPKCVPYEGNLEEFHKGSNSPSESADAPVMSPAYPKMLETTEFRLACLSAVSNNDAPLHLSLEVYPDDDHPEYECASYTWGGEDGDSTKCRPIYVGPYWDVLLQTKNCYSLLKFLRPWRGTRMVWVDAICINQENISERATQVAKMRSIYSSCLRVIVYLGEDIVSCSKRFPRSAILQDLGSNVYEDDLPPQSDLSLTQVLSRKYFSRLWVIQELILAPNVIIRVGDVNFRVDADMMNKLGSKNSQAFTPAPWAQFMTQCMIPTVNRFGGQLDTLYAFRLTAHSCASDPRDRVFGIISLFSDSSLKLDLAPDYELTFQQFNVGFFAYLLLIHREYWFLGHAGIIAKLANKHDHVTPSWLPSCRSDESWKAVMASATSTADLFVTERSKSSSNGYLKTAPFVLHEDQQCTIRISQESYQVTWEQLDRSLSINDGVDRSTGALLLKVTRFISLRNGIILKRKYGNLYLYAIHFQDQQNTIATSSLILISWDLLDIHSEIDHIFIPHSMPNMYLLLRQRQKVHKCGLEAYQLVTSRIRLVDENVIDETHLNDLLGAAFDANNWSRILSIPLRPFNLLEQMQVSVATVLCSLQQATSVDFWIKEGHVSNQPNPFDGKGKSFRTFFRRKVGSNELPILTTDKLLLRKLQLCETVILAKETGEISERHRAAFLESIDPRFEPKLSQISTSTYIIFTVEAKEWKADFELDLLFMDYCDPRYEKHSFSSIRSFRFFWWDWQREGGSTWHKCSFQETPALMNEVLYDNPPAPFLIRKATELAWIALRPKRIRIRVEISVFLDILHKFLGAAPSLLRRFMNAYDPPLTLDAVFEMVQNGPTEEQHHMMAPKYVGGGVRIDGTQTRVKVV